MFWSALLTTLWGLVTAFVDSGLDQHWLLWKKLHSKDYSSEVGVAFQWLLVVPVGWPKIPNDGTMLAPFSD